MAKCVFRTDLKLRPVSDPLYCVDSIDLFSRPGMPTVEECVQRLVAGDEISLGLAEKRTVMKGPRPVGYIRIVDECECARGVAPHPEREKK